MDYNPVEELRRVLDTPIVNLEPEEPDYPESDNVIRVYRNGYTYVFTRIEEGYPEESKFVSPSSTKNVNL